MSLRTVTLDEKIAKIGRLIADERRATGHKNEVLSAIYADLTARTEHAPSVAIVELDRRVAIVKHSKIPGQGYGNGQLVSLAQEVVCRWAIIRQALERFGAAIEEDIAG